MIEASHNAAFESVFGLYTRYAIRRAFHAVWVRGQAPPAGERVVFAVQHVAWWDPLVMFHLIRAYLPRARHFAMMDEANLRAYRFFRWIGAFGVDRATASRSTASLRYALACATQPGARLIVFPQGRQAPMDARPLACAPGTSWLAARADARVVPVALRYEFLEEQWPDVFVSIGEARTCSRREDHVEQWLADEADRLRDDVWGARLASFTRLVRGRGKRDPIAWTGREAKALQGLAPEGARQVPARSG